MKIEKLPNKELQKIATAIDDGDKELDRNEFNIFVQEASKALYNHEISLKEYNQIWAVAEQNNIIMQGEINTNLKDMTFDNISKEISSNNEEIENYKNLIEKNDIDYCLYEKNKKAISSKVEKIAKISGITLSILTVYEGVLHALIKDHMSSNIMNKFKKCIYITAGLGIAGLVTAGITHGIHMLKGQRAKKSEKQTKEIYESYQTEIDKLENKNKEYKQELHSRVDNI